MIADPQLTLIDFRWRRHPLSRHTVHMRRLGEREWRVLGRFWTVRGAMHYLDDLHLVYNRGVEDGWHRRAFPASVLIEATIMAGRLT